MTPYDVPTELITLIARQLELSDLLRLSAVNSTFRRGCYDRDAVGCAVTRRSGSRLTQTEIQHLLGIDRMSAATLAHLYNPKVTYHPRGMYLYDPRAVAAAMQTVGCNDRVVSWKRPRPPLPNPIQRRRRCVAAPQQQRPTPVPSHATPYADWRSWPNAASLASSAPPHSSWLSPSGCAMLVM